jgi:phosphatidylserine/phosphatidylglycerophosphate/cardiolipin synthase-like enzyme
MTDFTLLEAEDYYQTLLKEVPKAKKRIVLAAMVVLWGERTAPIFVMLQDALARGVTVTILLDNYTRLPALYGLYPKSSRKDRVKQTMSALENLSRNGAQVYCFGKLGFPPYKGRCHVKATIIDDRSYSFGGINFFDQVFTLTDYMLASNDPKVADCLEQLVGRIGKTHPPLLDGEVPLSKGTSILFDGGRPKHSLIYERACELTARAKRVDFFGQMVPSGQLATLLRETDTSLYSNRPEQMLPIDSLGQAFDQQRYRLDNLYQGSKFIHAKIILFTLPGGKKALLSGSHNFSYRGVNFGTQELALCSTDYKLWDALHAFVQKYNK